MKDQSENSVIFAIQNSLSNHSAILVTAVLSYSTMVLYSRDSEGVCVARDNPKKLPQFFLTT